MQETSLRSGKKKDIWNIEVTNVTTAHVAHRRIFQSNRKTSGEAAQLLRVGVALPEGAQDRSGHSNGDHAQDSVDEQDGDVEDTGPTPCDSSSESNTGNSHPGVNFTVAGAVDPEFTAFMRSLGSDRFNLFRRHTANMMQALLSQEKQFHSVNEVCTTIVNHIYSAPAALVNDYIQPFVQFLQSHLVRFHRPPVLSRRTVLDACGLALFENCVHSTSTEVDALHTCMKEYYETNLPHNGFPGETRCKRQRHSPNCR